MKTLSGPIEPTQKPCHIIGQAILLAKGIAQRMPDRVGDARPPHDLLAIRFAFDRERRIHHTDHNVRSRNSLLSFVKRYFYYQVLQGDHVEY